MVILWNPHACLAWEVGVSSLWIFVFCGLVIGRVWIVVYFVWLLGWVDCCGGVVVECVLCYM